MVRSLTRYRTSLSFIAGAALASTIGIASALTSAQDHPRQGRSEQPIRVATYDPQTAFSRYHRAEAFNREATEIQQELARAQEEGDQQRMMELQTRLQQSRQEVVNAFYDDIEKAAPQVAEGAGIQVVAVDVVYTASEVDEPRDITSHLIRQVNREAGTGEGPQRPQDRPAPPQR